LGVLCDLYTIRTNLGEFTEPKAPGGVLTYKCDSGQEEISYLPQEIVDWAELDGVCPRINDIRIHELVEARWSFNVIAAMIEEYL
jgi:hypothetical protein